MRPAAGLPASVGSRRLLEQREYWPALRSICLDLVNRAGKSAAISYAAKAAVDPSRPMAASRMLGPEQSLGSHRDLPTTS